MATNDDCFLELQGVHNELVEAFDQFVIGLPESQKKLVTDYLDAVTEMEYRKTQLAYQLGKQVGQKKKT